MSRTFTVIGGGSAYAPGLLAALIHHAPSLGLSEVRLHDIDEPRLEIVHALGARMAEHAGVDFAVRAASALVAAVEDADVVLNSARPGGFECRRIDETLPLELGIPGQETVGPGGFFFALRSVPQALRLAEAIHRHAPKALLLNYTNPTNIVTQALGDRTPVRVVGLCDQSDEDLAILGRALGPGGRDADFECVGLNHATWYSSVSFGGRALPRPLPELRPPDGLDAEHRLRFELSVPLARAHGGWPNSYIPYYVHPERFVDLGRRAGPRTDAIVDALDGYYDHFAQEARKDIPELRHHRGTEGFGDLAVRCLLALDRTEPTELVLNVPNRGITGMLADDTVVEGRVGLGALGIARQSGPEIGGPRAELILRLEDYQRAAADAAADGDERRALAALTDNPLVSDGGIAATLLERAKRAYGPKIPMFE